MKADSPGRYDRQLRFALFGEEGQRQVAAGRALVCGCGALGSVIAETLVRAGVGFVRVVDRDFLELNNLQRQVLFDEDDVAAQLPKAMKRLLADVERGRAEARLANGGLEHLVLASEERTRKSLSGSRLLVKVGPSLGLLGTLIPMGTALAALSTGNLDAMAGQMVVAFTTTIIGLACGTAAYVILTIRQHWVTEAVREQRFLAERIAAELAQGA